MFQKAIENLRSKNHTQLIAAMLKISSFKEEKEFPFPAGVASQQGGVEFIYNPEIVSGYNEKQKECLLLHELCHILLDHSTRFPSHEMIENVACDLAINSILVQYFGVEKETVSSMDGCLPEMFGYKDCLSSEDYLKLLKKDNKANDANPLSGIPSISVEKLAQSIADAYNCGQMAGKDLNIPNMSSVLIQKITIWKIIKILEKNKGIVRQNSAIGRLCYDWNNPSKLYQSDGLILPSTKRAGRGGFSANVYMDISGSCQELFPYFTNIVAGIHSLGWEIKKFGFNDSVFPIVLGESYNFGGTVFPVVERHVKETNPDLVIMITDLEGLFRNIPNIDKWHVFYKNNDAYMGRQYIDAVPKMLKKYNLETI